MEHKCSGWSIGCASLLVQISTFFLCHCLSAFSARHKNEKYQKISIYKENYLLLDFSLLLI